MKVVRDEKVKLIPLLLNRQKEISLLHLLSNAPLSYCFSWFTLLISASPPFRNTDALKQQETILLFNLWIFFSPSVSHCHVCVCVCLMCLSVCVCVFVCFPPSLFFSLTLSLITRSISHFVCVWESVSGCSCVPGRKGGSVQTVREGSANNKQITLIWITTGI